MAQKICSMLPLMGADFHGKLVVAVDGKCGNYIIFHIFPQLLMEGFWGKNSGVTYAAPGPLKAE